MRKHKNTFFLIVTGIMSAPAFADTVKKGLPDTIEIAEPDRGNFEEDASDAAARMMETLRMMRRNKFFKELDKLIDSGDAKKAEELLEKKVRDAPEQKDDEACIVAKSKIAYAKGDYQSAYTEADRFIKDIEKAFAPQRPYEIAFKDKNQRDSVCYAYILRFQALSRMLRHEEALADLNRAQQLVESPELLRAKTSTLLWLGKYAEAAATADKAYAMDKNILVSSPYREHYCRLFSGQGYNPKACANSTTLTKEKTEK